MNKLIIAFLRDTFTVAGSIFFWVIAGLTTLVAWVLVCKWLYLLFLPAPLAIALFVGGLVAVVIGGLVTGDRWEKGKLSR